VTLEDGDDGDSVSVGDPSEAGFVLLRDTLSRFVTPPDRALLYSRLYGERTQVGWIALCVHARPLLGAGDLLRDADATSLTFGLTRAAEDRVRAHEPTDARLAFTVDGRLVLAIAPLDALRLQPEPVFTLYRQ
jgi:hypothetical protein